MACALSQTSSFPITLHTISAVAISYYAFSQPITIEAGQKTGEIEVTPRQDFPNVDEFALVKEDGAANDSLPTLSVFDVNDGYQIIGEMPSTLYLASGNEPINDRMRKFRLPAGGKKMRITLRMRTAASQRTVYRIAFSQMKEIQA